MGRVNSGIANTPTSTTTHCHRFQSVFCSWELQEEHRVVYAYGPSLVLKTQLAYDNQKWRQSTQQPAPQSPHEQSTRLATIGNRIRKVLRNVLEQSDEICHEITYSHRIECIPCRNLGFHTHASLYFGRKPGKRAISHVESGFQPRVRLSTLCHSHRDKQQCAPHCPVAYRSVMSACSCLTSRASQKSGLLQRICG
jgi:hypothetical protein